LSIQSIISSTLSFLLSLSKIRLVVAIDVLRKRYVKVLEENEKLEEQIKKLEEANKGLQKNQLKAQVKEVNKKSNQPSSKQAEWEIKGVGNDGQGKKKGRGKKGRKGAGNKPKNKVVTKKETVRVEKCGNCGKNLAGEPVLRSLNTRIIEDIPSTPMKIEVIEVKQEKKYCTGCQKVTTAKTDLALPQADIGLNTTVHLVYLWISMCLPFTRIATYFNNIFSQVISTAGLCSHVIRVSKIMTPVYDEILEDVRNGGFLHADETGWRVKGKNWWLWVFGNHESAVYTIDKSRGKDVVRRILGEFFTGVLVVDGWSAYLHMMCEQQSCMAHLLRKIRKLYAAFPRLRSVYKFYIKFRKILRDGERLQSQRKKLDEFVFKRRLKKLHDRLDELLKWSNPNEILALVIKKVKRQQPRILTFVEHPDVPCHNNYGEYLIRIGVLKRKVSFGSKSPEGAQAYATLLSIYTTCKLRDISYLHFLKKSLQYYTQTGKPMLLQQYIDKKKGIALAA